MDMSDYGQLLARARGGDAAAQGAVLAPFRNYLALLARVQIGRRLRGKVDASDLVQDVFLAAARNLSAFRGRTEAEVAEWLRQILRGCLLYLIRRYLGTKRRDVRLEQSLAAELDATSQVLDRGLVARQSSPSQQAERRERAVRLADALARLPPDYRDVLVLRHLEGLRFAEVADRLGRSTEAAKKLWARALDRLRRVLGEEPP